MLRQMGFCEKWMMWIDGCLKSSFVSVLVNGCPIDEFSPQRGLKQGDPLAPFLFNIVVKGLMGLMRETQKKNLFKGFLVGRDGVEINTLQYVDNMVFFGEATMSNVKAIKAMLRSFELVSGLKINFATSSFGAYGRSYHWVRSTAGYLNCRLLLPGNPHRGTPIGVV